MVGNTKIIEELEFHPRSPVLKYQAWGYLDDKEALRYLVSPSDHI